MMDHHEERHVASRSWGIITQACPPVFWACATVSLVLKPKPQVPDFVSWTAARFPTEEARDRFLLAVATLPIDEIEGKPMPDALGGAWVRWRPGKFLGLNDVAYAHGGRIVFRATGRHGSV